MLRLKRLIDYLRREAGIFRQFLQVNQANDNGQTAQAAAPPALTWADSLKELQVIQ